MSYWHSENHKKVHVKKKKEKRNKNEAQNMVSN